MPQDLTPAPIQAPLLENQMLIGGSPWPTWFQLLRDWVVGFNNEVTASGDARMDESFIADSTLLLTLTVPTRFVVGQTLQVIGRGSGGWRLQLNAGQRIRAGASTTTAGGTLSSTNRYDTVTLKVMEKDLTLSVISHEGTLTYA